MEAQEYVRSVLSLAGFTHPTNEIVDQIYATAVQASYAVNAHPYSMVDALVDALRSYYPVAKSLEFIESIEQLQSQAGQMQEELATVSQSLLDMARETQEKPRQKMPYYQKDKASWWKGSNRRV